MESATCIACNSDFLIDSTFAESQGLCEQCRQIKPQRYSDRTHRRQPSLSLTIVSAVLSAVLFYLVGPLLLLRDSYCYHLFCGHGWVPYTLVALFFAAFWILLLKIPILRQERKAFELALLPEQPGACIELADAQKILNRIGRLDSRQNALLLVIRIRQAILRLNQLGTAETLDDLLRYRAESDADAADSAYAAPKFIIWAIPVLGFVGTVLGISNGVQSFSTLIQNASDLEGLRESLKGVTYGLGQAFETTMVALCMSLILMFLMSLLQRHEDRLLGLINDYCLEHLLHRIRLSPDRRTDVEKVDIRALIAVMVEVRDATRQLNKQRDVGGQVGLAQSGGKTG